MRKARFGIVLFLSLGALMLWKMRGREDVHPSTEAVPIPDTRSKAAQTPKPFPETFVPQADLPMMLPTNEAVLKKLREVYGEDNLEKRLTFFLGINAQLNRCAGGKVPKSRFLFWVKWRPSEDGTALVVSSVEEIGPANPGAIDEGGLSPEQKKLILDCAREYTATAMMPLEKTMGPEEAQDPEAESSMAVPARFPVSDNMIYSFMSNPDQSSL